MLAPTATACIGLRRAAINVLYQTLAPGEHKSETPALIDSKAEPLAYVACGL